MHELLVELYESGKLHQPRQFGRHPQRMPYYWLECFVPVAVEADSGAIGGSAIQ